MNPEYPIYIISKGRWKLRHTSKALELLQVPYHIVIEPQEYDHYSAVVDPSKILVLPFSNLGQGSIPARNWVWKHSIDRGAKRHWILDDNIYYFFRLHQNHLWKFKTGSFFKAAEDFVDRYSNVPMAGLEYEKFRAKREASKPFALNRRVYSCILLSNEDEYQDFRWRGRYNEDTDLSLRFLKAGYCTILFYIFLAKKIKTQVLKGGNTDELYKHTNQRLEFAESLMKQHPDVVTIQWKYNRWHHKVDYSPFKHNRLKRRDDLEISDEINNYGMVFKENKLT